MNCEESAPEPHLPDQKPLTGLQVRRLANLTEIEATEFCGLSVTDLQAKFRGQIDSELLSFAPICGRVVKTDPATGRANGVPFATVYAEDMTCSLLGLFPAEIPLAWFFPFRCDREVVAESATNAFGNFRVWLPRFEIEWILRSRGERLGRLGLFNQLAVESVMPFRRNNPMKIDSIPAGFAPVGLGRGSALFQKAEQVLAREVIRQLFEDRTAACPSAQREPLTHRAFHAHLAPQARIENQSCLDSTALHDLDLAHYYGPFLRSSRVEVSEWVPIFDLPDITFRVTQDTRGPDADRVIYSGGLFEVSWRAGNISDVTLPVAPIDLSPTARKVLEMWSGDPASHLATASGHPLSAPFSGVSVCGGDAR